MTIEKNGNYIPALGPKSFFTFHLYSKDNHTLLTSFTTDYWCTIGNTSSCYLQLSKKADNRVGLQALNYDFSPIFSFRKLSPPVVIIPNSSSEFSSIDWDLVDESKIKYFDEGKKRPSFEMPTVWVLSGCAGQSE